MLAFEKNFAITVKHLEHVGTGTSEDATKARGMVKAIKTEKFVRFLYFLLHVTKILRELSLQFQSDYLFITEVSTKLETALTKLECLKVGLNLKFDYKMQFLFLEKSETSGIEESHDMSF